MKNDPAILFYTSDFMVGVSNLTMKERGQYITLLCLQHQLGHLSKKTIDLNIKDVSDDVLKKFKKDSDENYYNERLEFEIKKRAKFCEHQSENGKKGGRPRKNENPNENPNKTQIKPKQQPKQKPLENENVNDNINININTNNSNINNSNINNSNNSNNIDIFSYIEEQLGRLLSPAEYELVSTWEDNELTRYAIKQTALSRASSLKYTQAILNSYKAKGIKSVIEAEKDIKQNNNKNLSQYEKDMLFIKQKKEEYKNE